MPQYEHLVSEAAQYAKDNSPEGASEAEVLGLMIDRCAVNFGCEILKIVPGYVSTEVDARLSFDVEANVSRGRRIIKMYEDRGIPRERILIKLATTWEGVQSAKLLEAEGIHCNLTLLFAFEQAVICGEAGVTLISPFVGRIMDWYKAARGVAGFAAEEDPGCISVKRIYNYYKKHDIKTIVMGASFRNKAELLELAG
jgi:transaldolase